MSTHATKGHLENLEKFPGWEKAGDYLKKTILESGAKVIADIGGGANPMIDMDFIEKHGLEYYVFDISASELAKADPRYRKVEFDITCDDAEFRRKNVRQDFDFVFSHMMLEHVEDPVKAHVNFSKLLKPGGLSVHFYPSMNNFPLAVNWIIPESLSGRILRLLQPHRTQEGNNGKFKAYYRYCGAPSLKLEKVLSRSGFDVVQHTAYVGHEYYKRIKPLAMIEKQLRNVILALNLPLVTCNLLILRKSAS
jgi:SAM-dependent methyltransferase